MRDVGKIISTCQRLHAAASEELWQGLLFASHPYTTQLPASVFDHGAGRGYRWYFEHLAERKVPDTKAHDPIPPPVLSPSDLVLLVELKFDGAKHASQTVQGEALEEFLSSGRCTVPVTLPWSAEVQMNLKQGQLSLGEDLARLGYHASMSSKAMGSFDGSDIFMPETTSDWKVSVKLLRLTDFKVSCLVDDSAQVNSDTASMFVEGKGWSWNRSWGWSSFDRTTDLFEGCQIEFESQDLPLEYSRLHGTLLENLKDDADFQALDCMASPVFSFLHSPRFYVYDWLSAGDEERLRPDRLLPRWKQLDKREREQAIVQAEQQPSWRSMGAGPRQRKQRRIWGTADLVHVEVALWVTTSNGADLWKGEKETLLHLIRSSFGVTSDRVKQHCAARDASWLGYASVQVCRMDRMAVAKARQHGGLRGVVPPMTALFHSKVGIFTPLRPNNYHVRIAKLIGFGRGAAPREPSTSSNPMRDLRCERDTVT